MLPPLDPEGLTVLVVEPDDQRRAELVRALRRLGMRALGVVIPDEAVELLNGIEADVVLLRDAAGQRRALERLRRRTRLVVVSENSSVEDAAVELLRALGRPDSAARLN
jgi:CheY-like chemotaxis protein